MKKRIIGLVLTLCILSGLFSVFSITVGAEPNSSRNITGRIDMIFIYSCYEIDIETSYGDEKIYYSDRFKEEVSGWDSGAKVVLAVDEDNYLVEVISYRDANDLTISENTRTITGIIDYVYTTSWQEIDVETSYGDEKIYYADKFKEEVSTWEKGKNVALEINEDNYLVEIISYDGYYFDETVTYFGIVKSNDTSDMYIEIKREDNGKIITIDYSDEQMESEQDYAFQKQLKKLKKGDSITLICNQDGEIHEIIAETPSSNSQKDEEKQTSLFTDITKTDYYAESVNTLFSRGVISGYEDGSFRPEGTITRAEFAAIICRMIGKEDDANNSKGKTSFDDVSRNHWASGYINVASKEGIINGDGKGNFRPEDKVKYEEAIKMVVCALGLGDDVTTYSNDWSKGYIEMAEDIGITENLKGQKGKASTRGDIAVMVDYGLEAESMGIVAETLGRGNQSIVGTYKGTYTGTQGLTGVTLLIRKNGDDLQAIGYRAVFEFYPTTGSADGVESGNFNMTIKEKSGLYEMSAGSWINKAPTYVTCDIKNCSIKNKTLTGDVYSRGLLGGFVGTINCQKVENDDPIYTTEIVEIDADSFEEWEEQIDYEERSLLGISTSTINANGTYEHHGKIIVDREVLEYKEVDVKIPLPGPENSDYKTITINLPAKVKYTLHEHKTENKNDETFWGSLMAGLVEKNVVWTQSCSCGYENKLTWSIPLEEINKFAKAAKNKYTGADLYIKTETRIK